MLLAVNVPKICTLTDLPLILHCVTAIKLEGEYLGDLSKLLPKKKKKGQSKNTGTLLTPDSTFVPHEDNRAVLNKKRKNMFPLQKIWHDKNVILLSVLPQINI